VPQTPFPKPAPFFHQSPVQHADLPGGVAETENPDVAEDGRQFAKRRRKPSIRIVKRISYEVPSRLENFTAVLDSSAGGPYLDAAGTLQLGVLTAP
jgi:hypothetical protein